MYALPDTPKIQFATAMAKHVHAGQKYGNGLDYFEYHIMGVVTTLYHSLLALKLTTEEIEVRIIAAILHDIVEDQWITIETIRNCFGDAVADAVDALSKRKGEDNHAYLIRCKSNVIAKVVKHADSFFNASNALCESRPLRVRYYSAVGDFMRDLIGIGDVPPKPKFKDCV